MSFLISPGVKIQEIDLSNIIPSVATSIAAIVGTAPKGPVIGDDDCPTLITSQAQFVEIFGEPDGKSFGMYAAMQFLEAGNKIFYVRVVPKGNYDPSRYSAAKIGMADDTSSQYWTTDATHCTIAVGPAIGTERTNDKVGTDNDSKNPYVFKVYAKTPGEKGDEIKISIINHYDFRKHIEHIKDYDEEIYWTDNPDSDDEFILLVWDQANKQYVESWTVSRLGNPLRSTTESVKKDARGRSMFIEDVINTNSEWIRVQDNPHIDGTAFPGSTLNPASRTDKYGDSTRVMRLLLGGGSDGTSTTTVTTAEILEGWDEFANPEEIDINIMIQAGGGHYTRAETTVQNKMLTLAKSRADCIAILDAPLRMDTPMKIISHKRNEWNPNSSYGAYYWPWVKDYDRYVDRELWLPPSVFAGYVYALTDYTREVWFAPAGLNRGIIDILDIKYKAKQGERDLLYLNNINPIAFFPGEGTAIWGQKTLQRKSSALDRVNVRRLFLVLEKAIAKAAKYILFEPSDRFTRKMLIQMIEPFLRDVQARRGITYYSVVCDESNNPPVVIDRNELIVDIFIQPTKAVEFITLRFNILRTGVLATEQI